MLVIGIMLSVKISTKNQIAVPSEARRKLGLKAGDRLDVEVEGDVIHLRLHVPAGTRLLGIGRHLYDGTDAAERIRAMRDADEARWIERQAEIDADIRAADAPRNGRPSRSTSCASGTVAWRSTRTCSSTSSSRAAPSPRRRPPW
jgi:AbrB family looped-hinge helix DNA binding protein